CEILGRLHRSRKRSTRTVHFRAQPTRCTRRMLLPPNELSIVEAYLSGDVEIEGSMEAASNLGDMIGDRLHSPLKLARLIALVLQLPGKADDDLADARFPERARKLGPRHTPVRDAAAKP